MLNFHSASRLLRKGSLQQAPRAVPQGHSLASLAMSQEGMQSTVCRRNVFLGAGEGALKVVYEFINDL